MNRDPNNLNSMSRETAIWVAKMQACIERGASSIGISRGRLVFVAFHMSGQPTADNDNERS